METQSTSSVPLFEPDSLVWAKMKGFPPWPAKVNALGDDTPHGRIPVTFFGTRETAFIKPSDLYDYIAYRSLYEVPRRNKGFNDGIHEIRVAAGLEAEMYRDEAFFNAAEVAKSPSPAPSTQRPGGRLLAESFLAGYERKRSNSASTVSRSRASSSASALKQFKREIRRRRLDSESSGGSRRNKMISGFTEKLGNDLLDHFSTMNPLEHDFSLLDDDLLGHHDEARSTKSKRSRGSSKLFEDYLLGVTHSRSRHRSGSASEGRGTRSRLISGVSDVFDELFNTGSGDVHIAAEQFLHTLDELPSESSEERPGTPEAPAPLPPPVEFCKDCGCECKVVGNKWRCTSKYCQKWNGLVNNHYNRPSTSIQFGSNTLINEVKPSTMATVKQEQQINDIHIPMASKGHSAVKTNMTSKKKKEPSKVGKPARIPKIEIKREKASPKKEMVSPKKEKTAKERIREEFERTAKPLAVSVANTRKRTDVVNPRGDSMSPPDSPKSAARSSDGPSIPVKRATGRPKQYKVEKTPPMGKNGQRHCTFCTGQVRPQMCGGNKHRWRCVDKKCRKWYGWVKSSDEIPRDLGRKGRYNSVLGKQATKKSRELELRKERERARLAAASLDLVSIVNEDRTAGASISNFMGVSAGGHSSGRKKGRPPKQSGLKIKLNTKEKKEVVPIETAKPAKRKYVRRKDREPTVKEEVMEPQRAISPMPPHDLRYRPCAMEKRARWWTSEKRRMEVSPEREFQTTPADSAAAFRILSHAFRAAAVTRADEPGTVNGSLDLLMDSLIGCMAPLLSLLGKLPNTKPEPEVLQQLWNASGVHLPMFP